VTAECADVVCHLPSRAGEVAIVDPLTSPAWDRAIANYEDASIFHTSSWARVLARTYGHTPLYLEIPGTDDRKILLPLMEIRSHITSKRAVSLPFTDVCRPLGYQPKDSNQMIRCLAELGRSRGWKRCELRTTVETKSHRPADGAFVGHQLSLFEDVGRTYNGFTSSVRRAIRKAERSSLTVRTLSNHEGIADYYRLHAVTRRRHGLPPQPFRFFENLETELFAKGLGFAVLAYHEGNAVAGAIFLRAGKAAVYKFGASNQLGRELRANNLVIWEGIKQLSRLGCVSLHLGRTEKHNDTLRRFKSGWGAHEEEVRYYRFDPYSERPLPGTDRTKGWHTAVFSRLPLMVNRFIGTMLYSHLD
jgi:hypothetical protein